MIDRSTDHAVESDSAEDAPPTIDPAERSERSGGSESAEPSGKSEPSEGSGGDVASFPPPTVERAPGPPNEVANPWRTLPRPGLLTPAWRWTLALAWIGVFVGLSAVWKTSRELGLPTWWLGPLASPRPIVVMLLPFVAPTAVVLIVFNRATWASWAAVGAGIVTAAIALGDLQPYARLGIVELLLAAAGTAVGVASFSGRYRRADDVDAGAEQRHGDAP